MNRFLLFVIGLFLSLGLIGYATTLNASLSSYAVDLITLSENLGIIMMLVNGTFVRTGIFKVALFFIALSVFGFLFRIMHMPGADQLLLCPFMVLFCLYFIHFLKKKSKTSVD